MDDPHNEKIVGISGRSRSADQHPREGRR